MHDQPVSPLRQRMLDAKTRLVGSLFQLTRRRHRQLGGDAVQRQAPLGSKVA
jgi:hypothetical protein